MANAADTFSWNYTVSDGLVSQQEMTRDMYKAWVERQLSTGIADREFFEKYLKYFDNGKTITVYTYQDGAFTILVNN